MATSGVRGNLSIYSDEGSYPIIYKSRDLYSDMFCTYDDKGNLFVDGTDRAGKFELAELEKGASNLRTVTVNKTLFAAGPIQWDGHSFAVGYGNALHALIFQITVSGSKAVVTGSTRLKAKGNPRTQFGPFWIEGGRLVASFGDSGAYPIGVWNYPAGGDPTHVIRRGVNSLAQRVMTVSLAPR